ncbi:hypothetical protein ACLMJK_005654 [Lecanora helva]
MDKEYAIEPVEALPPPPFSPMENRRNSPGSLNTYLAAELSAVHTEFLLLACCLSSGLVDSTVYNAYGTFVSMQTGNTIFVGLGGSTSYDTQKPFGWAKSLLSISTFCFGCFFFTVISRAMSPLRRRTLLTSFLLQTLIILATAGMIQGGVINGSLNTIPDDIDWWQLIPIGLLSFQSAGQIVASRALGVAEIPSVVVTSMLHDIASDKALLKPLNRNIKRNRRILAFFTILIGAVIGGFISESTSRMQVPLWVAGGVKLCITIAWVTWPVKKLNEG